MRMRFVVALMLCARMFGPRWSAGEASRCRPSTSRRLDEQATCPAGRADDASTAGTSAVRRVLPCQDGKVLPLCRTVTAHLDGGCGFQVPLMDTGSIGVNPRVTPSIERVTMATDSPARDVNVIVKGLAMTWSSAGTFLALSFAAH